MSIHEAHPVLELEIDTIEQFTEVSSDIVNDRELLCSAEEHAILHFLPEFATHNSRAEALFMNWNI